MKINETRWVMRETDADLPLMSRVLRINEITANAMANRGIRSKNAAISFLAPTVERLRPAFQMKGMEEAIKKIAAALPEKKIIIYGDYDADGIMSTVILYKTLKKLGANCEYYIPHRIEEGYGLNIAAVEKLASGGGDLLITVDNGISAIEEIKTAAELGVQTIIIDHHEPGFEDSEEDRRTVPTALLKRTDILPSAVAIVDPKQSECEYPFKEMCAAGLVFRLAVSLCEFLQNPLTQTEHDELLVLAAVATLCDIVNLTDENRVIVTGGLAVLNANKLINPGLGSLITLRGYLEKPIDTFTVGFVIGPCLNATGRLESAALAVELLLAPTDETPARLKLAQELIELNEARKNLTLQCVERALSETVDSEKLPKVLVLTDFEAHESVAGIVAGRIRDATCRPTILLTQGNGAVKGSGRSVEGYNLFEALYRHRHLFNRFGGHKMAAGLTLPEENIGALRTALNNDCTLTDEDFHPILQIDRVLSPDEISLALSDELARLAPFGKGNAEPLFASYGLHAEKVRIINEKNTLIFTFVCKTGRRLKGIAFGLNENYAAIFADKNENICFDAVYCIETNVWNNNAEVQIRIKDFRC
ncbi:MAG: DHH family phosphoesterase [Clostridiales bacterium]|jgi:single-stranded-DNA-specific exonuclease|nr:DHH family phosphoesterase [Clostridiales bacterium]